MRTVTMAEALNEALREELTRDPKMFLIGEDIGLRGGAFTITKNLYREFPDRVIDTPISENAIAGMAYGAAITGVKAVAEFMYSDFCLCGVDHIINSAAKFRTMFGAQSTVPVVYRLPSGGGRQNAAQHSQSLEAIFANVPGLKIILPSNPKDAKGLLKSAIHDNNPIIFMEHKAMYFHKGEIPDGEYTIPIGKGDTVRNGKDITIIAVGMNVAKSLKAAVRLAEQGIDAEVIDMRTIVPYDKGIILESVRKTGRLLVTHESPRMYGIGGEIVSMVVENCFDCLKAPPARVAGRYIPHPYNKILEDRVIPQDDDIFNAALKLAQYKKT
jgi:pyruvate dehydrogenase E1 component beta subunit